MWRPGRRRAGWVPQTLLAEHASSTGQVDLRSVCVAVYPHAVEASVVKRCTDRRSCGETHWHAPRARVRAWLRPRSSEVRRADTGQAVSSGPGFRRRVRERRPADLLPVLLLRRFARVRRGRVLHRVGRGPCVRRPRPSRIRPAPHGDRCPVLWPWPGPMRAGTCPAPPNSSASRPRTFRTARSRSYRWPRLGGARRRRRPLRARRPVCSLRGISTPVMLNGLS